METIISVSINNLAEHIFKFNILFSIFLVCFVIFIFIFLRSVNKKQS